MATDNTVTLVGNLTDDPELRFTPNGAAVANFRLAVTPRVKDGDAWKDGETSFFRINCWRALAENVTETLGKGARAIIAAGRSLHLQVAETPYSPQPAELPSPAEDGLLVAQQRPPWVVDLPEQEQATATVVAGELPSPQPVLPPPSPELPRLRLQLATAIREGDELALRRVLKRAARVAPAWDAQAELAELTAARRRRRRNQPPAWRSWLNRIAHSRRTLP